MPKRIDPDRLERLARRKSIDPPPSVDPDDVEAKREMFRKQLEAQQEAAS